MKLPFVLNRVWEIFTTVIAKKSGEKKKPMPQRKVPERVGNNRIYIAACLRGGLGEQLIGLAWVHVFFSLTPEKLAIDIYGTKDLIRLCDKRCGGKLYKIKEFKANERNYDLSLWIDKIIHPSHINMAAISGISPRFGRLVATLHAFSNNYGKYRNTPQFDGAWAKMCAKTMGWDRWSVMGASGVIAFSRENKNALSVPVAAADARAFGLPEKYITVHTARLLERKPSGKEKHPSPSLHSKTKSWPVKYWGEFCRLFKAEYPDIGIVQLGQNPTAVIEGTDMNLVDRTSLREAAAIVQGALLHVDEDSGLVHWRYVLGGSSVVLFGPTVAGYVEYPENANIRGTAQCGECMWMLNDWSENCVLGHTRAECMWSITPETVLVAVRNRLEEKGERLAAVALQDASEASIGVRI
ncbi:MAG: hypothetical protein LBR94_02845 [Desulfovibrio sp.]|jgi:hypothetical protein|nr:hypothetical protein [Desulfovibrio sp.]